VQVVSGTTFLYNGNPFTGGNSSFALHRRPGTAAAARAHVANNTQRAAAFAKKAIRTTIAVGTRKLPATSFSGPFTPPGPTATSSRIFVIALDTAGNQIINPTTFDIPITLTLALNGMPAGSITLGVTYAGLTGEGAPASTSADGGTVVVLAPSDVVTLTLSATTPSSSPFEPSIAASFTPQGGTLQTTNPLSITAWIPPSAAFMVVTDSEPGPYAVNAPGDVFVTVANTGTLATSGQIEADIFLGDGYNFNSNDVGAGSDPSWTCNNLIFEVVCTTNAAIAMNGTLPLVLNITPNTTSPFFDIEVFGGSVINSTSNDAIENEAGFSANANPGPALLLGMSVSGGPEFTTVPFTYNFFVTNNGTADTTAPLSLVATLPAGITYNSFSGAGWSACTPAGQTITCTYPPVVTVGLNATELQLNVTPTQAIVDTTVTANATVSGGGAASPAFSSNQIGIASPIYFTSETLGSSTALLAQPFTNVGGNLDQEILDIGFPPGPAGLSGNINITAQYNFTGLYTLALDSCTGSVIDGTFAAAIAGTPAGGTGVPTAFGINVVAPSPATCAMTVSDTNGNSAVLNLQVESTGLTIQSHARKPATGVIHR
jgi:hypothetical protein